MVGYRYGFNGKENDNEVGKGEGNQVAFEARIYDPRVGRFLSIDPNWRKYPMQSTYVFANSSPVAGKDEMGEDFVYAALYGMAKATRSGIAIQANVGVSYGIGISAARGMAVDKNGNFALFYSFSLPSIDNGTFNVKELGVGANVGFSLSVLPLKGVDALPGEGFSVGGTYVTPTGLGGGGSVDFSVNKNGVINFQGLTFSVTTGAPNSIGISGANATLATLFSKEDYNTLFETKWDQMGVEQAQEWTNVVNDGDLGNPVGFWKFNSSEEVYEPVKGTKNQFEMVVKQNFSFQTSGRGASLGMKEQQVSRYLKTGIIMVKTDNYTLQSTNYRPNE